ncbi:unnamed protein product [Blumeria hordei]|uniref:C2H2-type domain-containing protein n=2 Tax=Blumeria hordei TaxID=2867405 RepID=A0A383UTD2_BLUHO|nr:zinc finger protein [Blumeria hordei DH14]SZF03147.1 unnamed protein product [Blumeria hordei]
MASGSDKPNNLNPLTLLNAPIHSQANICTNSMQKIGKTSSPTRTDESLENTPGSTISHTRTRKTVPSPLGTIFDVASRRASANTLPETSEMRFGSIPQSSTVLEEESLKRITPSARDVITQKTTQKCASQGIAFSKPAQQLPPRLLTQKKHKCPYCDTEFTRHHNLKSHLLTHSQEKPYICQTCAMRFRRLHDLKRHMKLHTGERPHICPKCDRKFARGDALARHIKGQGGCAGRRSSIGSFGGDEDLEDPNTGDGKVSAMDGVMYSNSTLPPNDTECLTEESRKYNHSNRQESNGGLKIGDLRPSNQAPGSYISPVSHSKKSSRVTYLLPEDRGSIRNTIVSHVKGTSLRDYNSGSNLPTLTSNPSNNPLFAQGTLPDNSKSLSSVSIDPAMNRQRSPRLDFRFQQHRLGNLLSTKASSGITHSNTLSEASGPKLPALASLAPSEKQYKLSSQESTQSSCRKVPSAITASSSDAQISTGIRISSHQLNQNSIDINPNNNLYSSRERGVWVYVQTLEDKVKHLTEKVQMMETTKKNQEDKINRLSLEVFSLKAQLDAPKHSQFLSKPSQS